MEKTSMKSFFMTASLAVLLVLCLSCEVCNAREGISKVQTAKEGSADAQWWWGVHCPWTFPHPRLPPFWLPRLPPLPHWPWCPGFPWPKPAPKPGPKPAPKPAPKPVPKPKPSPTPAPPAKGKGPGKADANANPGQGAGMLPRSKSAQKLTPTAKPTN